VLKHSVIRLLDSAPMSTATTRFRPSARPLDALFSICGAFSYYTGCARSSSCTYRGVAVGGLGMKTATAAAIYGTTHRWVPGEPAGRVDRRPAHRTTARRLVCGILIRCGHFSLAVPLSDFSTSGLVSSSSETGSQANISTMSKAVRSEGRAPRRGFSSTTWGSISRVYRATHHGLSRAGRRVRSGSP